MQITNISDAKSSLSHLIQVVQESKQSIIIGKAGKPVAILSAYNEDTTDRVLGGNWEGKVTIDDHFDVEMTESFYSSSLFPDQS